MKIYHRDDALEVYKERGNNATSVIAFCEGTSVGYETRCVHGWICSLGLIQRQFDSRTPLEGMFTHFIVADELERSLPGPTNPNVKKITELEETIAKAQALIKELKK